jgi:hypothetical protein
MTAWSHLPNALLIDRILDDLKTNPSNWFCNPVDYGRAWPKTIDNLSNQHTGVYMSAFRAASKQIMINTDHEELTLISAKKAARCSILALIVWDEVADYLNMSLEQVQVMISLGDDKAALIKPAVIAFEKLKRMNNV